jgi:hypothetical protein
MKELAAILASLTNGIESLSITDRVKLIADIGRTVAAVVPHGEMISLLGGICEQRHEVGDDHVAEAVEAAMVVIEDAESFSL